MNVDGGWGRGDCGVYGIMIFWEDLRYISQ